ncbi:hypothetical protein ACFSGI_15180 [Paenibacillus nicotianae]|uniref:Uncharacterized protein n=1 Tax=Paenibacillus nicotianae TaxID=1526551 RepID=A0ABW4UXV0_9BACL
MNKVWSKASAILLLGSAILFSSSASTPVYASSSAYTVTFQEARMVSNDHVGNEWAIAAKVAGKAIDEGKSVNVNVDSKGSIKLYGYVIEEDKIPDEGENTKVVNVSSISSKGSTFKVRVTVTENRGRYSGNEAIWEFTYKIKKQ